MGLTLDPAWRDWRPRPQNHLRQHPMPLRVRLARRVAEHAARLGTGRLRLQGPLLATGHQASLWHPGILAKDLAALAAARRFHGEPLHLVVDQDVEEQGLALDLPTLDRETEAQSEPHAPPTGGRRPGDARPARLRCLRLTLAPTRSAVPTGMQPPVDARLVAGRLRAAAKRQDWPADLAERLHELASVWLELPETRTLAEQLTALLIRCIRRTAGEDDTAAPPGPLPVCMVTDFDALGVIDDILDRFAAQPLAAVHAYNRAVADDPQAGVPPLLATRELVELPLWALRWQQPRDRVYLDLGDSRPLLVDARGEPVDRRGVTLAPRALMLTALMRGPLCDLFVHGLGGGRYDRITERWATLWPALLPDDAATLAPMTVATADLHLPLHQPAADSADLAAAMHRVHHAPHNVDRLLRLDPRTSPLAARKQDALATLRDAAHPAERRFAWGQLRALNRALVIAHPEVTRHAAETLERVRLGLSNRRLAMRRDWFFALYPPDALRDLAAAIHGDAGFTSTPCPAPT